VKPENPRTSSQDIRIGVDLGGTKIEGIILSPDGKLEQKLRIETPGQHYESILEALLEVIVTLQRQANKTLSVGIGTPGALSFPAEVMKNCNSISLNGRALKKDVEAKLGYEVRIENDANCFALSEAHYGAGAGAKSVFGVIIGTGTGGGVVINKSLLTGPNSIAGEWGHNSLPSSARELIDNDRRCYCGRSNCIETVLSGRGLSQTHLDRTGAQASAKDIAKAADAGEGEAIATLDIYIQQLAQCLATVTNLIDPEVIVLGGGLSNIKRLYDSVPSAMADYVFTDKMLTRIEAPSFGDASGARGAACLWPIA
jgi:predicted NBD/HSP70 family sugar kinase